MPMPLPTRVGGFGGVDGLKTYLQAEAITHVIDATHPFAAQMSGNAIQACADMQVPLLAFTRPPWTEIAGDTWQRVPDIAGAVSALDRSAARIFLAIGQMHLAAFAAQPQHSYLLRLVDPPSDVPLPNTEVVIAKGPFSRSDDLALLQDHQIELVISKNSGGDGAYAKIAAARQLGLPVVMIDRPTLLSQVGVYDVADAMNWLGHSIGTDLGV